MNKFKLHFGILLLATCLGCKFPGQRLLEVQIQVDGAVQYQGFKGVDDDTPIDQMWNVIGRVNYKPVVQEGTAEASNDTTAHTLRGDICVEILHTDNALTSKKLTAITLEYDAELDAWKLSESEVRRVQGVQP